jgi:hypothetical protein
VAFLEAMNYILIVFWGPTGGFEWHVMTGGAHHKDGDTVVYAQWIRYGEWLITCPVILIALSNLTGLKDDYNWRTMKLLSADQVRALERVCQNTQRCHPQTTSSQHVPANGLSRRETRTHGDPQHAGMYGDAGHADLRCLVRDVRLGHPEGDSLHLRVLFRLCDVLHGAGGVRGVVRQRSARGQAHGDGDDVHVLRVVGQLPRTLPHGA